MRNTISTTLAVALVGATSVHGQIDQCAELLRLSRITARTVVDQTQLTRTVDNFCDEMRRARSASTSLNLDLRILGLGQGGNTDAATNSTFTKYCSEQADERYHELNYRQYLEDIAPGAYTAYYACTTARGDGVEFQMLTPTTRDALELVVFFRADTRDARAHMSWSASEPVNCQWESFSGDGTVAPQQRTLQANERTRLRCGRTSADSDPIREPDYVNVIRDGGDATINIPWPKYNDQDEPVQTLEEIRRSLERDLAAINATLDTLSEVRVQTGMVSLPYASSTRPVVTQRGGRLRGIVGGRVDFPVAFARAPEVHMALAGVDMSNRANARLRVRVTSVDREGFEYELYSWDSTHVYTASASWVAFMP